MTTSTAETRAVMVERGSGVNVSKGIRQLHRWLSIGFPLGVIIYVAAMARGRPAAWVGLLPLVPLILLLLSGLYMFALPYAVGWRKARATSR